MFLYPFGDFHSLNLGWFLLQFKDWTEKIQEYLDNGGGTAENLANVIAPVFNAANTYLTGDYVLYNNELYKANQIVNPGTWDPDAWTRCLIVDEIGSGGGGIGVDNVARLMIAGEYSETFGYQKYGICRYNDKLWMANTNLPSTGEAWNPTHWDEITVGAGLSGLRRSADTLAGDINTLNTAVNILKNPVANRKMVFIGDSYGLGTTASGTAVGLSTRLKIAFKVTSENWFSSAIGGSGFVGNADKNFSEQLDDLYSSVQADADSVSDVIFCGGYNDNAQASAPLYTAVTSAIDNAVNKFKNAKIWVIMCAYSTSVAGQIRSNLLDLQLKYASAAGNRGAIFLCASDALKTSPAYMSSDGIHPTDAGYTALAQAIAYRMQGGNTPAVGGWVTATLSAVETETAPTISSLQQRAVNNNIITVFPSGLDTFNIEQRSTKPTNQAWYKLANISGNIGLGLGNSDTGDDTGSYPVHVYLRTRADSSSPVIYKEGIGLLSINYGGLWIKLNNLENASYMNYNTTTHIAIKSVTTVLPMDVL